jgi:PTH1 family peptidyl-tRNA hydrolase
MKIVAGLGNPGPEYADTRHNTGYRVVDLVAARNGGASWRERFRGLAARVAIGGEDVWLVKPVTFMNLSGECVSEAARFYKVELRDMLVVTDDMALEVGVLRVRRAGSSGGHNGLESVEEALGTDVYPRLRIGIGPSPEPSERSVMEEAELRAAEAVEVWATSGVEECMNGFN